MFRKFRLFLHHHYLNRKLKKQDYPHQTTNFEKAKRIGILFDGSKPENFPIIKNYLKTLRNKQKTVVVIGFISKDVNHEFIPFNFYSEKDVNWIFIPRHPILVEFLDTPYDLLINLYTEECLSLEYLSAMSKAKYRVGRYIADKTYCYDLMINLEEKKDLKDFIKQIDHYVNLIK